jgi:hypothetical protein
MASSCMLFVATLQTHRWMCWRKHTGPLSQTYILHKHTRSSHSQSVTTTEPRGRVRQLPLLPPHITWPVDRGLRLQSPAPRAQEHLGLSTGAELARYPTHTCSLLVFQPLTVQMGTLRSTTSHIETKGTLLRSVGSWRWYIKQFWTLSIVLSFI